jgi:hypothetical protein
MEDRLERARAYLDVMEADRQAALALSEQKAEEAKLIKARQEGFQAAMEMLRGPTPARAVASLPEPNLPEPNLPEPNLPEPNLPEPNLPEPKEPGRRRTRRRIRELILRELSFSGHPMTARQIAKAIDYNLERTETALTRMEEAGQVLENEGGLWAIRTGNRAQMNAHAVKSPNGKLRDPIDPQPSGSTTE